MPQIRDYRLITEFTSSGGGQCQWAFAERNGSPYFVKKFLSPRFPVEGSAGSERTKAEKRKRCEAFEAHHRTLMQRLRPRAGAGGSLVVATDFFREGSTYYKVTEKIDTATLPPERVARLDGTAKMVILRSVARSVQILHSEGIVHGDLKPDNILLKSDTSGGYVARLIDFDNSFFSGNPPEDPEEVVGDVVYYSPELAAYVQREPGTGQSALTPSSDIYALGLIYCRYLTGDLPRWDRREFQYAFLASNSGAELSPAKGHCSPEFEEILCGMLSRDLKSRPKITDVQNGIQKELSWLKGGGTVVPVPDFSSKPRAEATAASSVPGVKPMLKKMGGASPASKPAPPAERPKLKINIKRP